MSNYKAPSLNIVETNKNKAKRKSIFNWNTINIKYKLHKL